MCKEMSTGFFFFFSFLPVEWVYCSGDGEMSGERGSFHMEGRSTFPLFMQTLVLALLLYHT